ncbi:ClpP-like prohead protease/major capsid protein fusion protein [Escherichia coli]|uniref:ClpP-like prohead protease/major capsid protein fusion protein n=3 Tax=Escherichia TaxID=561 RepID=UPI0002CC3732|nr:ClpP-like prohead protease/major capsid protein fusion protein [Escherichia coli]EEW4281369.1 peptidase [Escherichia coli]EHW2704904.1 Clp protease ClpP [Escherichia coli]ELD3016042.1 Clp protease ClpP [Escherichia coli]ELW9119817.1 Clp protease ClpP [Escherichia coli]ELZ8808935.1 Clp protease ClpP [Escherichia coli]
MNRWYTIKAADVRGTAEISIYEEIGGFGITAKQFTEDLKVLGDVSHINLRIHSPGGDVFEGIAIYNLLRNHPADITVYIDGVAASMASVVAMAGDRVVMPENAMMMIHKPWGISGGNAGDMRDYADLLDKVETVLIPAYARKTGKSAQEIATMLEDETWMDGKECLKHGFADELLPSVRAMARIESKRTGDFLHMPETIKGMITPPKSQAKNTITGDQERINGIKEIFSVFGNQYDGIKMSCLEDASCTLEMARERLLKEMGKNHTPTNKNIPSHIYAGNGNITGDAIRQGLYSRLGYERPERGNPYAMMSLFEMAQASLTDRGISVGGFLNRSQVVNAAFTHSSSDFSHILAGGAEKSVLKGWQDSGETFQKWTRTGSLSNFHEAKRVGLNGFSKLDKVPEGAEYKYITTSDKGVPIALATYGNIFSVTRQAIINDDLTQLTTIPMAMGRAAARTVGNLVYLLLTSNGKFTDGKALFHADHKNLIAKDMDMVGLDEARKLMRLQEDANGDSLNITPAFVLVPAALESAAHRAILSSSSLFPVGNESTLNQNPGIINVVKDMAEVIVEPRLDKANSKEWYVAAAKGMDTIEVAYLDGIDTPYLEEQEGFTVDGVAWKVRIDAGVAALDYRGLLKSSGA